MLEHYFVEDDYESIEEISKILIKIRSQFTLSATDSQTLWSVEFQKLLKLNEKMKSNHDKLNKLYQEIKMNDEDFDSSDDGFETFDEDDEPDSKLID